MLLVDDDVYIREMLKCLLEKWVEGDFNYLLANNGYEALQIVFNRDGEIAFISTDCRHPCINGIELSKIIKRYYPHIPIMLFTGWNTVESEERGLFDSIITKPFKVEDYPKAVKKLMDDTYEVRNPFQVTETEDLLIKREMMKWFLTHYMDDYSVPEGTQYEDPLEVLTDKFRARYPRTAITEVADHLHSASKDWTVINR